MRDRTVRILRLVCLALAVVLIVEARGVFSSGDESAGTGLELSMAPVPVKRPGSGSSKTGAPSPDTGSANKVAVSRFEGLTTSGVFGARPVPKPPPPPVLTGIVGDLVLLQLGKKQLQLQVGGKPVQGIRLLEIGVNRVLIEQQGLKREILIFGGIGGTPLLEKPKPNASNSAAPPNVPGSAAK